MTEKFKSLGKLISKQDQKTINGSFNNGNPFVEIDRDGRECRFPYYVNSFGRCAYNYNF